MASAKVMSVAQPVMAMSLKPAPLAASSSKAAFFGPRLASLKAPSSCVLRARQAVKVEARNASKAQQVQVRKYFGQAGAMQLTVEAGLCQEMVTVHNVLHQNHHLVVAVTKFVHGVDRRPSRCRRCRWTWRSPWACSWSRARTVCA